MTPYARNPNPKLHNFAPQPNLKFLGQEAKAEESPEAAPEALPEAPQDMQQEQDGFRVMGLWGDGLQGLGFRV